MIPSFGTLCLGLALLSSAMCVGATAFAYRVAEPRRSRFLEVGGRASRATFGLLSLASLTLFYLFLADDFSVTYVFAESRSTQPTLFKLSAFWGGMQGSVLMWAWILALYGLALGHAGRKLLAGSPAWRVHSTAIAAIAGVNFFFIGLNAFASNPFALVPGAVPIDGRGLNPLLQNTWMQIHPPTLYFGYVGCTVPWALAAAGLIHRKFDNEWVLLVRRWGLLTWIILTVGIIMGGAWAYETLGWGGYWAWDPVENASLLPWLTATAFLHSIMIQARRGTLKSWNITLVTLTFLLSVFGTAMTRSGWVSSVHAFVAETSTIGNSFMGFLLVALAVSFGLIIWRRDELRSDRPLESPLSREGAFLLNNWLLLASTAAVLWGTVYPSIASAFGHDVVVNENYYNKIMVPLGLALLALTGIGPLLAWRRASLKSLWKVAQIPVLIVVLASPVLWYLADYKTGAATAFTFSLYVTLAISSEFWRGTRARMHSTGEPARYAFPNLVAANRHRYGGYIVHLGIAMIFMGICGSSVFKIKTDPIVLKPGQEMKVRDKERASEYTLIFKGFGKPANLDPNVVRETAALMQIKGTDIVLTPAIRVFKGQADADPNAAAGQEPQTARMPSIYSNYANDLYLTLDGYDLTKGLATGTVEISAFVNPLVMWIWASSLFFIVGTVVAMWPGDKKLVAVRYEGRERIEQGEKAERPVRAPSPVTAAVPAE